jgi:hypothetical protein
VNESLVNKKRGYIQKCQTEEVHRETQKSDRISKNIVNQRETDPSYPLGERKLKHLPQGKLGSCHNKLAELALGQ